MQESQHVSCKSYDFMEHKDTSPQYTASMQHKHNPLQKTCNLGNAPLEICKLMCFDVCLLQQVDELVQEPHHKARSLCLLLGHLHTQELVLPAWCNNKWAKLLDSRLRSPVPEFCVTGTGGSTDMVIWAHESQRW